MIYEECKGNYCILTVIYSAHMYIRSQTNGGMCDKQDVDSHSYTGLHNERWPEVQGCTTNRRCAYYCKNMVAYLLCGVYYLPYSHAHKHSTYKYEFGDFWGVCLYPNVFSHRVALNFEVRQGPNGGVHL